MLSGVLETPADDGDKYDLPDMLDDQARPTRKLLDWKPLGTRPVGRTRKRWQEDVMEDLKELKIKNWKETAKDRGTWRDLAEKAKTHKGL
jgi:hypothetical protein